MISHTNGTSYGTQQILREIPFESYPCFTGISNSFKKNLSTGYFDTRILRVMNPVPLYKNIASGSLAAENSSANSDLNIVFTKLREVIAKVILLIRSFHVLCSSLELRLYKPLNTIFFIGSRCRSMNGIAELSRVCKTF